jgi:hypothetical protein
MLGVSKTQFKTADQFRQTMQSLLENLQNNTSLADLVGSQERADKLIASFREYFFGDTLTKENISEYEAMFIPEYLHSAIVRIQSPDEVRIFRNSDGEIQTINLSKPSQSSTL